MLRRATRVLIAFLVALAVTMPAGARAMPMPAMSDGVAADQPCQKCPQPDQTGNTTPDKMPACQAFVCASALATLPAPALVPGRIQFRIAYALARPARWADTAPAPDPFPPRPIVLL
jgi:hypothetical protein